MTPENTRLIAINRLLTRVMEAIVKNRLTCWYNIQTHKYNYIYINSEMNLYNESFYSSSLNNFNSEAKKKLMFDSIKKVKDLENDYQ